MPGSVNRHRTDARTERWREHKLALRREFVDAAFRALAKHGPEASMDEIAAEAGTVKPKLYRHFAAKSDLAGAVSERMGEILWQRLLPTMNLRDAPRVTIRRGLEAYVNVVDEYPNVFKFLMRTDSEPLMESGKEIVGVIANVLKEFRAPPTSTPSWRIRAGMRWSERSARRRSGGCAPARCPRTSSSRIWPP